MIKPAAFESGTFNEVKATEMRRFGVRVVFVLAWEEDILAIALAIQEAGWAWVQIEKVGPRARVADHCAISSLNTRRIRQAGQWLLQVAL